MTENYVVVPGGLHTIAFIDMYLISKRSKDRERARSRTFKFCHSHSQSTVANEGIALRLRTTIITLPGMKVPATPGHISSESSSVATTIPVDVV